MLGIYKAGNDVVVSEWGVPRLNNRQFAASGAIGALRFICLFFNSKITIAVAIFLRSCVWLCKWCVLNVHNNNISDKQNKNIFKEI